MSDFKITDENNIEREATLITVVEVDGKEYVIYSIDRDAENVNIFVSALKKDLNGNDIIVDIDIKGFFDNVNHSKLLKQIWTLGIRDKKLMCIISTMLKAEIKGIGIPEKGTPQGGILSPLLSNIVLNELDWWIASQWEFFPLEENKRKNKNYYLKKF